ncbi:MAG: stage 0 sporulation family protein [Pseudomonadota bacterium]|nr:stage 0 sporulation family protein [Pseudomonadota bacterium]
MSEEHLVGVKFKREGKVYYFLNAGIPLRKDDHVIVETENGTSFGVVVAARGSASAEGRTGAHKSILRKAADEDLETQAENQVLERDARRFCVERVAERGLPMKIVDVEYLFDRSKVVFYFTAENRVDFRELIKDLVQRFKTRIELRQIGARQEARMIKGMGICGREVCCATMLHNLDRVSVKMAKEQSMSLNPEKISGLCGRLMCCLAFEYETYLSLKKDMPKCGKFIQVDNARGKVVRQSVLKGEITMAMENGEERTVRVADL